MRGALLSQYLRVKAEHQAAILLFRLGDFYEMFFDDAVTASRVCDLTLTARNRGETDEVQLRKMIEDHHKWTGSLRARHILDHWAESRAKFVKVFPHEYKRALGEIHAAKEAGDVVAKAKSSDKKSKTVPAK